MTFLVMSARSLCDLRANNLQPKRKRLSIVFATVDTTKQGVGEASLRATINDYATCAVGHGAPHGRDFSARYSSCRSSFPHYDTLYGNMENSKSTPISPTAVSHTAFRVENGFLFALRAALLPNKIFKNSRASTVPCYFSILCSFINAFTSFRSFISASVIEEKSPRFKR